MSCLSRWSQSGGSCTSHLTRPVVQLFAHQLLHTFILPLQTSISSAPVAMASGGDRLRQFWTRWVLTDLIEVNLLSTVGSWTEGWPTAVTMMSGVMMEQKNPTRTRRREAKEKSMCLSLLTNRSYLDLLSTGTPTERVRCCLAMCWIQVWFEQKMTNN